MNLVNKAKEYPYNIAFFLVILSLVVGIVLFFISFWSGDSPLVSGSILILPVYILIFLSSFWSIVFLFVGFWARIKRKLSFVNALIQLAEFYFLGIFSAILFLSLLSVFLSLLEKGTLNLFQAIATISVNVFMFILVFISALYFIIGFGLAVLWQFLTKTNKNH